ncbi:unnamed protein product, partial [Protopolystoma xenopodis]
MTLDQATRKCHSREALEQDGCSQCHLGRATNGRTSMSSDEVVNSWCWVKRFEGRFNQKTTAVDWLYWNIYDDAVSEAISFDSGEKVHETRSDGSNFSLLISSFAVSLYLHLIAYVPFILSRGIPVGVASGPGACRFNGVYSSWLYPARPLPPPSLNWPFLVGPSGRGTSRDDLSGSFPPESVGVEKAVKASTAQQISMECRGV